MNETIAAADVTSVDRERRTVIARIYSGASIPRRDPLGVYSLVVDASGVDFSRAAAGVMPLLLDHADSTPNQVGVVARVWREGQELYAELRFGESPLAEQLFHDVVAGIRRAVSTGLSVVAANEEIDDDYNRRIVVGKSELFEVSIVPIPADGRAVVLSFNPEPKEVLLMSASPIVSPAVESERARVALIFSTATVAKLPSGFASPFVANGSTIEVFRAAVFEHLAAESDKTAIISHHSADGGGPINCGGALRTRITRVPPASLRAMRDAPISG